MTRQNIKPKILSDYINRRMEDNYMIFDMDEVDEINKASSEFTYKVLDDHPLLFKPTTERDVKPSIDAISVALFNDIMPKEYYITDLIDIKDTASRFVLDMDTEYPNGTGMNERQCIQYLTCQSSSAFSGIQRPSNSIKSNESMRKTLKAHSNPEFIERSWMLDNIQYIHNHVERNPHIMDKSFADIVLVAKHSSASIKGEKNFRDFVMEHTMDDILDDIKNNLIPMLIRSGVRIDRRGKYRVVCSFDGRFRVIDYILNNGSYELCEGQGILSKYTTEGYNNAQMWPELVKMADRRSGKTMICLDYEGYDTQISMREYLDISFILNKHRLDDPYYKEIWEWYEQWMTQPKPLVSVVSGEPEILIDNFITLASGLNGTHSFQNMIGISTKMEAENRGIKIHGFWANGDDQNALVDSKDVQNYIDFIEDYWRVSWNKSLVGHKLAVWGKLWFAKDFHPAWEIGTFRSIWEKEGSGSTFVEPSKLQTNYCKILQVAITLIRLGYDEVFVRRWINDLCEATINEEFDGIDPNRIPVRLNSLSVTTSNSTNTKNPVGLRSVEKALRDITFRLRSLSDNNWFDMLMNMYRNKVFYNLTVDSPKYHVKGTVFYMNRSIDFSKMVPKDVPWIYKDIYTGIEYTLSDQFNRDVLQSTKSFDGPCSKSVSYTDMYSLANCINDRNKYVWERLTLEKSL